MTVLRRERSLPACASERPTVVARSESSDGTHDASELKLVDGAHRPARARMKTSFRRIQPRSSLFLTFSSASDKL